MKTLVIYHSKTGVTREFAYEISKFLKDNSHESTMMNILDVQPENIQNADAVFIGCWTHGLFFFLQHPDKIWQEYARNFPEMHDKKVALFTTYKVATGSMFKQMMKVLNGKLSEQIELSLKSKNGKLNQTHKEQILKILN
jgi:flavodoxin